MSKELARKLIQRIANDSIRLAIVRNCLEWDKDDPDMTEDEIVEDTISVVNGDDIGCAEESELTPENSTHLFVEQELNVLTEHNAQLLRSLKILLLNIRDDRFIDFAKREMYVRQIEAVISAAKIGLQAKDF